MTLTDAGPLFALVDKREKGHAACVAVLPTLRTPLTTPWPCFTEAMYLSYGAGGWPMQRLLWRYVTSGQLRLHIPFEAEADRMEALMEK